MSSQEEQTITAMEEDGAASAASGEDSSGEESSGEESSGEEDVGAGNEASAPQEVKVKEPEHDRLEGESQAAYDKRKYAEEMRAARASRKEGEAAAEAAQQASNSAIARGQVQTNQLPPLFASYAVAT